MRMNDGMDFRHDFFFFFYIFIIFAKILMVDLRKDGMKINEKKEMILWVI